MSPEYNKGYWTALDAVLSLINGMTTDEPMSQDEMRRKIYGEVMSLRPKELHDEQIIRR